MYAKYLLVAILSLASSTMTFGFGSKPLPTVTNFNATAWKGFWYELYHLPQADETGCSCSASLFSPNGVGQWVDKNYCYRLNSMESMPLNMYVVDAAHPERLAIGLNKHALMQKMWIIDTDYKTYTLIGSPNRRGFWIYSRSANLSASMYHDLTQQGYQLGFKLDRMKAVEHDPNLCKYTNAVTTWEPAVAAMEEEEPLDNTTLYQIKDGECGEVSMDSKYAPEATKFDKDLKEGTCTSVGYTVADGTQTVKVPVLGSLTVHKYKKPSVTMLTAGDGDLPTQTAFNATAWEGMWYELYSLRQPDEAFCTCTASKFAQTLMPGKWTDQNYCKRFGKMESVPLSMYQLDRRYPERLAIGVSPKHTFTKMWVIKTDYESYSLIGDPSRKALWIYGRAPGMDRTLYSNLTTQASELGFNVAKLKMTDQANNCKYPDN